MPIIREAEADIRVPVTAHLQPQLRLYRRLWLAQIDLEEAKAALDEALRARIPIPRHDQPPPLLLSLTTALVVAYSRPWVYSRGQSVAERTVPASLTYIPATRGPQLLGQPTKQRSGALGCRHP